MLGGLVLVLNMLGFLPAFCNFYTDHIYGALTLPLSYATSPLPFALGEILMYMAALMVVGCIISLVALALHRKRAGTRKRVARHFKAALAVLMVGLLLFTLNWSIPFRSTPLSADTSAEHTLSDLQTLRNYVIEGMNEAAANVPRTDDGGIDYSSDVDANVIEAMQALSAEYPRLSGYYPPFKAALCTDVLEWMGIGGYTYPYTMELTYNTYVTPLYYPILYAHESVHHKGHFLESEAEFLSFLGCSHSDDAVVRYSAYEGIYYYVESAYVKALMEAYDSAEATACFEAQVQLSDQVVADITRTNAEREENYQENVNSAAEEAFSGLAEDAAEIGWGTQDQVLQTETYSGVVGLLLDYYEGKL